MTKDDIMKLARKAGLYTHKDVQPEILAFANLVAAHKAEVITAEAYRCGVEAGTVAEREACAKWLDFYDGPNGRRAEAITVQRQPLSEKQVHKIWRSLPEGEGIEEFAQAIQAAHGIKDKPSLPLPVHKLRRGDTLRCIETDELCTVWSTSTTGWTLVKWAANDFGTYTAEQIGELFWIEPREAEPVAWDKPSASFNEWWDSDRRRDNANPFTTDSFAYWAFEGWQAALAQRPWQGLEAEDLAQIESDEFWQVGNHMAIAMAVEAKLKEKNHG